MSTKFLFFLNLRDLRARQASDAASRYEAERRRQSNLTAKTSTTPTQTRPRAN